MSLRGALGRLGARVGTAAATAADARTIQGVDTETTAFVGAAASGAPSGPTLVTSYVDYLNAFGAAGDELDHALRLFFDNDGRRAYAIRAGAGLEDAFPALEQVPFALLALPGAAGLAADEAATLAAQAVELCVRRRAFLVLDPPAGLAPDAVEDWAQELIPARNAAVYVPRLRLPDGSEAAASGAVAGVFARTDRDRAVWRPPAGTGARVRGAADVTQALAEDTVAALTVAGVNVVRRLPTGIFLWGVRTLAPDDAEWKYINVRRLALFIERSVQEGIRWAVFEPNGPALWTEIRRRTEEFLHVLFVQGAFEAIRPEDAYFVRCDRTTMTQDDIDNGRLVVLIGFAPVRPAEFVVLHVPGSFSRLIPDSPTPEVM